MYLGEYPTMVISKVVSILFTPQPNMIENIQCIPFLHYT